MRRRRAFLVAALAVALGHTAFEAARSPVSGTAQMPTGAQRLLVSAQHHGRGHSISWPAQGQAALVLGTGRPAASLDQRAAPIASLAKVMTAYLTLRRYPLSSEQAGFAVTITAADAQAEANDVSEGQSGVAVEPGEQLTERQLLEALLIPSGNNIAEILADEVAGSKSRFVAEMNAEARALGMRHTLYTDPSGFDPSTVSTAADQLRIFRQAMHFAVFRQIVSMYSVTLPVAGTVTNFDPLITVGYSGKTGSDAAAGGCLAFFTHVTVGGRGRTAVGVVMGQGDGNNTSSILAAAGWAAQQLIASATHTTTPTHSGTAPGVRGGRRSTGAGRGQSAAPILLPAQN